MMVEKTGKAGLKAQGLAGDPENPVAVSMNKPFESLPARRYDIGLRANRIGGMLPV